MKKLIFLGMSMVLLTVANAQDTGLKGGINFSNLYVDDVDDENMKIGFQAGVWHRVELLDFLAIQPEFLFTQKGSEIHYDRFLGGSGKYKFNLNYLEVPVLGVLKVGNVNFQAGPYVGLLVSAKVKDVDDNGSLNQVESLDRDDFNTFDMGVAGGVGFDFTGGTLGARYNYGFKEIGKEQAATDATENSKNSVLQLYLGFAF